MKILVTGFDPFGTDEINPAIEAVKKLPDTISGAEIIKVEIPTSSTNVPKSFIKLLLITNPIMFWISAKLADVLR